MSDTERRALALRLFGSGRPGEPGPLDPGWVVERLAGSRQTLSRWRKVGIPPDRVEEVLEAVAEILPGTTKEAAPPEWAERLEAKVDRLLVGQTTVAEAMVERAITALAPADQLRQAEMLNQRLEELLRLRAEGSPEGSSAEGRDAEVPPGQ